MPPKPFKPPRPSFPPSATNSKSKSKSNSTISKTTKPAISKSKRASNSNMKAAQAAKAANAKRVLALPSLSPDSSPGEQARGMANGKTSNEKEKRRESRVDLDEEDEDGSEQEEEEEEDSDLAEVSPMIVRPTSKSKSNPKSKNPRPPSSSPEPSMQDRKQQIPPPLVSLLLHTFLAEQGKGKMRISKDANKAVGVYLDTFVREAVARAAWGREERLGDAMGTSGDGGSLEVEDLERLGPQLLMDF